MRREIVAGLGFRPGLVIVDVGCGPGWFLERAVPLLGPTGRIYATDIDAKVLSEARERYGRLPAANFPRVETRLCKHTRDTAVDDVAPGSVDLILMIDSLCFPTSAARAPDIEYLRRFLPLLRRGGRFVHHVDCTCDTTAEATKELFTAAGFVESKFRIPLSPLPSRRPADFMCKTTAQERLHGWVGVFERP